MRSQAVLGRSLPMVPTTVQEIGRNGIAIRDLVNMLVSWKAHVYATGSWLLPRCWSLVTATSSPGDLRMSPMATR